MQESLSIPVTHETADTATQAYLEMRQLILLHRITPGTPIIQSRIADELGYTRATIRTALKRLVQEGYAVEEQPGTYSRFLVAALTVEDMEDLFTICGALEGVAARQCAVLPSEVTTEVADRMEALNRAATAKAESGEITPEEAARWDIGFHRALGELARGPRLSAQLGSFLPQIERYRNLYVIRVASKMRLRGAPEHQEIIEAIRSRSPDRAQAAVESHWRAGARRLRDLILEIGERRGFANG